MGIRTRRARKLRALVLSVRMARRNLDAHQLATRKRMAAENVARLKEQLTPGYRANLQRALAQWQAHLDSLEDDGARERSKDKARAVLAAAVEDGQ